MINIKDFDPNLLKIDQKLYKNNDIYYIGYITVKDSYYVKMSNVNPLYLIISVKQMDISKKKMEKRENMEETDTIICLKKRNKD